MPIQTPRVRIDGLWRCLCPSADAIAITQSFEAQLALIAARRPGTRKATRCRSVRQPSTTTAGQSRPMYHDASSSIRKDDDKQLPQPKPTQGFNPFPPRPLIRPVIDTSPTTVSMLLDARPPYHHILAQASIRRIYGAILELRKTENNLTKIAGFISYLIRERNQAPDVRMYESLIHANSGRRGSADAIVDLLDGMEEHSIDPSSFLCHAVLRALVNHPDYLIRENILQIMEARWYEVQLHGHSDILLGLLRDGQYEMAMDNLDQRCAKGDAIPSFVFDIFVYKFAEIGLLDDALRIIHHRMRMFKSPSSPQWFYLLERAADEMHYRCVKYVWTRQVVTNPPANRSKSTKINPPDGVVENVLTTASRYGDVTLAMQAMQLLTKRRTRLHRSHYETLIECYAAAGQLKNAILALSIMHKARCVPTRATTRPIFRAILEHPELLDKVIGWLVPQLADAASGGKTVHEPCPQAFSVALEAVLHIRGWDGPLGAMDMLEKAVFENRSVLDADSFNVILRECVNLETAEKTERLMHESRVSINPEALDLFLGIHSEHGSYEAVRRWAAIVLSKPARMDKLIPSLEPATKYVHRALREQDTFVLRIVKYLNLNGLLLHPDLMRRVYGFSHKVKREREERLEAKKKKKKKRKVAEPAIAEDMFKLDMIPTNGQEAGAAEAVEIDVQTDVSEDVIASSNKDKQAEQQVG